VRRAVSGPAVSRTRASKLRPYHPVPAMTSCAWNL
jgi:hypothetical protein